jgi:prepilin-type N-terminal cleavage/methylation domain-containing protein
MKINNAFTLVEILLVIIIIGIILALTAPNFSKGYSRFQLNKTADDLLSVSRWAQAMAIWQERTYALSFSDDRRSYDLVRSKVTMQNEAAEDIEEVDGPDGFEPIQGALGRIHKIPDAIRLESRDDRINFYPDGTINPATIQLASPDQKTVLSSAEVRGMMTKVNDE